MALLALRALPTGTKRIVTPPVPLLSAGGRTQRLPQPGGRAVCHVADAAVDGFQNEVRSRVVPTDVENLYLVEFLNRSG